MQKEEEETKNCNLFPPSIPQEPNYDPIRAHIAALPAG